MKSSLDPDDEEPPEARDESRRESGGTRQSPHEPTFAQADHDETEKFQPIGAARRLRGGDGDQTALARDRILGNYRLRRRLGHGAQGEVWLADNTVALRDCALKFILQHSTQRKGGLGSIREEARVLFELTHPGIVRLHNIELIDGHLFLVMELLAGPSLLKLVQQRLSKRFGQHRGLSVDECLWLLDQLAPALDYAAGKNVVHRDIKPGNIMLTKPVEPEQSLVDLDLEAKLCDFGIAFVQSEELGPGRINPTGTPPYMSPEVLAGDVPTPSSDIYSFAATLFSLHRGHPPHEGKTVAEIRKRQREQQIPQLESGDATFDAAVARALSFSPADRPSTFDEFLYEASGGRLGKWRGERSLVPKVIAALSVGFALLALVFALDPFGLRRGQVVFLPPEGQYVEQGGVYFVREPELAFLFDWVGPGDEELIVDVGGDEVRVPPLESGSDRYRALLSLTTPGPQVVTVRTGDGETVLGRQRIFLDNEVNAPPRAVRTLRQGPFDVAELVPIEFTVNEEGVAVQLIRDGTVADLPVTFESGLARYELILRADKLEAWRESLVFRLRDPLGNQVDQPLELEVYDRKRILTRLRAARPTLSTDLHPWDLEGAVSALARWEAEVRADPSPVSKEDREALVEELADESARARELLATRPAEEIALSLEGANRQVRDDAGMPTLLTRESLVELHGTIHHARGPQIEVDCVGDSVVITRAPVVDRATGQFTLGLTLAPEAAGLLTLSCPSNATRTVFRVEHDGTEPSISLLSPHGDTPCASVECDVECTFEDSDSGVARAVLVSSDGREVAFERADAGEVWRARAQLLSDAAHDFKVECFDGVGNHAVSRLVIRRDMTQPTLAATGSDAPRSTADHQVLQLRFSEPVRVLEASWITLGDEEEPRHAARPIAAKAAPDTLDGFRPDATFELDLDFEPAQFLALHVTASDRAGNRNVLEARWRITHEVFGSLPSSMHEAVVPIVDPLELERLLGKELAREGPYWISAESERFPRCVMHRKTGIEFVFVPPGTFQYGPRADSTGSGAGPGPEVQMQAFYIARTEVSATQFLVDGIGERLLDIPGPFEEDLPVRLSREEAGQWCQAVGLKLSSETQWEFAASGPRNHLFPWGEDWNPKLCNSADSMQFEDEIIGLRAVDAYPEGRSWCGALQMIGNVAEICRDDLPPESIQASQPTPPEGPSTARTGYISRGGSYKTNRDAMRTTYSRMATHSADRDLRRDGMRPVLEL